MVLGGIACALNLASSAMVNGICCMYQMQEEDERQKASHEAITRSIRNEYEYQRELDTEIRKREKETAARTSLFTDERRRDLMAKKKSSLDASMREKPTTIVVDVQNVGEKRLFDFVECNDDGSLLEKAKASLRVNSFIKQASRLSQTSVLSPELKTSSLLDESDCEEDEEDNKTEEGEEEGFEEIPIE